MKKYSLICSMVLGSALIFSFNMNKINGLNKLTMENIEVLAAIEGPPQILFCCAPYHTICVADVVGPSVMGNRRYTQCPF
jgi:hypothetical protein